MASDARDVQRTIVLIPLQVERKACHCDLEFSPLAERLGDVMLPDIRITRGLENGNI